MLYFVAALFIFIFFRFVDYLLCVFFESVEQEAGETEDWRAADSVWSRTPVSQVRVLHSISIHQSGWEQIQSKLTTFCLLNWLYHAIFDDSVPTIWQYTTFSCRFRSVSTVWWVLILLDIRRQASAKIFAVLLALLRAFSCWPGPFFRLWKI